MTVSPRQNISFNFEGQTIIVTGAARGIGAAIARGFTAAGATVFAVDLDEEELTAIADESGAHPIAANVASTEDVGRVIAAAIELTGRIDVLINNAGILRDAMLWKLEDADWEAVLAVHLTGAFKLTRASTPHFRTQAYGRVINVTSYTGLHGNLGQSAYATAKAGIIGFTKTAAKELARFGVTVNAISPNAETRMIASIPEQRRREVEAEIPLGRFGAPEEMVAAVSFLASADAGYITGVVLPVDGGIAM
jgi:3-oxoacyl-[acyl-carrier protein] reductase